MIAMVRIFCLTLPVGPVSMSTSTVCLKRSVPFIPYASSVTLRLPGCANDNIESD